MEVHFVLCERTLDIISLYKMTYHTHEKKYSNIVLLHWCLYSQFIILISMYYNYFEYSNNIV